MVTDSPRAWGARPPAAVPRAASLGWKTALVPPTLGGGIVMNDWCLSRMVGAISSFYRTVHIRERE